MSSHTSLPPEHSTFATIIAPVSARSASTVPYTNNGRVRPSIPSPRLGTRPVNSVRKQTFPSPVAGTPLRRAPPGSNTNNGPRGSSPTSRAPPTTSIQNEATPSPSPPPSSQHINPLTTIQNVTPTRRIHTPTTATATTTTTTSGSNSRPRSLSAPLDPSLMAHRGPTPNPTDVALISSSSVPVLGLETAMDHHSDIHKLNAPSSPTARSSRKSSQTSSTKDRNTRQVAPPPTALADGRRTSHNPASVRTRSPVPPNNSQPTDLSSSVQSPKSSITTSSPSVTRKVVTTPPVTPRRIVQIQHDNQLRKHHQSSKPATTSHPNQYNGHRITTDGLPSEYFCSQATSNLMKLDDPLDGLDDPSIQLDPVTMKYIRTYVRTYVSTYLHAARSELQLQLQNYLRSMLTETSRTVHSSDSSNNSSKRTKPRRQDYSPQQYHHSGEPATPRDDNKPPQNTTPKTSERIPQTVADDNSKSTERNEMPGLWNLRIAEAVPSPDSNDEPDYHPEGVRKHMYRKVRQKGHSRAGAKRAEYIELLESQVSCTNEKLAALQRKHMTTSVELDRMKTLLRLEPTNTLSV